MKTLRRDINLIDTRRISKGFEGVMINPIKRNNQHNLNAPTIDGEQINNTGGQPNGNIQCKKSNKR